MRTGKVKYRILSEAGTSLMEMTTVIVIAGILSAVAVVSYDSGSTAIKLDAASKKIVSDVYYAQDLAMNSGRPVKIVFNIAENNYCLKWGNDANIDNIMGGGNFIVDFDKPEFSGVQESSTNLPALTLTFNTLGVPYTGGEEILAETKIISLGNQVSIYITPYTGKLRVQKNVD